jgi:hypothetical protein
MACVLTLPTGKEFKRVDWFPYPEKPPSRGWPMWVQALENLR